MTDTPYIEVSVDSDNSVSLLIWGKNYGLTAALLSFGCARIALQTSLHELAGTNLKG